MILRDAERWFSEMRKGYARLVILSLLSQKPMHGYQVMKIIRDTFINWSPSASAIYPILHRLEEDGYVESVEERRGGKRAKVYRISPKGEAQFKGMLERHVAFLRRLKALLRDYARDILGLDEKDIEALSLGFLEAGLDRIIAFDALSKEEKIAILKRRRKMLMEAVQRMDKAIKRLHVRIKELEGEGPEPPA